MIRFIIVKRTKDELSGAEQQQFITVDAHCDEVEQLLKKGGSSQYGYEYYDFMGCEIIKAEAKDD